MALRKEGSPEDSISAHKDDIGLTKGITPENIDHIPADDTVGLYFRQMAAEPLLTADQEVDLAKRIERGREARVALEDDMLSPDKRLELEGWALDGQAAREHLGRANTRLVISIAKRYRNQGLPMSDLIQEGNVGLMISVDKFDYTMGNRFSTYASWWIRQTITRALSQKSRTIRLPLHFSDGVRRTTREIDALEQELDHTPEEDELAEHISDEALDDYRTALKLKPIPLEMTVGVDSEFGDYIEDEESPTPGEVVDKVLLTETVGVFLDKLLPREKQILILRFGLDGEPPQTLEQVGAVMGLSRERIRQIERDGLRQLRQSQFRNILQDFLID